MDRNSSWRATMLIATNVLAVSILVYFTAVHAKPISAQSLCGDGSAPDYGLTFDQLQPHWTVGWENYASEYTVSEVDAVLDRLNEDSIAQTMILILPEDEVGIRTNCAVHFLRYMQLGLPSGERKDNGFVFLIVVEPDDIDVHYAVGLGLPALTARELTNINRAVEDTYTSTHSMDEALFTLADEFDKVARENYEPLGPPASTEPDDLPAGPMGISIVCGQFCIGLFFIFFLIWMFSQMGGGGGMTFTPTNTRSWGRGFRGFPSGGGGSSGPRMRGGSGSGRSGRTN